MEFKELLIVFLTGGAGAAVVKGIFEALAWRRERKAKKEDTAQINVSEEIKCIHEQIDALREQIGTLREGMKYILYDRIKYLAQSYIKNKEVDFDDRRILNNMHRTYHNGLDGNGDLGGLMDDVNDLPLKLK